MIANLETLILARLAATIHGAGADSDSPQVQQHQPSRLEQASAPTEGWPVMQDDAEASPWQ